MGGVGNRGIDPAGLVGSDTGVFVGAWAQPYGAGGSDSVEGYALTGVRDQRGFRAGGLCVGVAGPGDHGGYRVLVVSGGHALGVSVVAQRGIGVGAGRWGHDDDHTGGVHRVRPPAWAGARWAR